jgi:hypothetical protein
MIKNGCQRLSVLKSTVALLESSGDGGVAARLPTQHEMESVVDKIILTISIPGIR